MFDENLIIEIKLNNPLAIAKSISMIENNENIPDSFYSSIYDSRNNAIRIGITGPPGAGKSTLSNEIVGQCLANDETVGVVAIDPTSPFSGGALLGDRVRMNKYGSDDRLSLCKSSSAQLLRGPLNQLFISSKLSMGKVQIRVLSDQEPIDGFKQVDPEIEDLYFATINELDLKEKI